MANNPAALAALKLAQEAKMTDQTASEGQEALDESELAHLNDPDPDAEKPQEAPAGEDTEVPDEAENAQEAPAQPESGPSEALQPEKVPESEGLNAAQATKQAQALRRAARSSPVRQLRFMLHRLAREWEFAAAEVEGEDELTIELVGSLSMGMRVPCSNKNGMPDIGVLVRVMTRDGQTSLHLEPEGSPMPVYLNFSLPSSPVAVYR